FRRTASSIAHNGTKDMLAVAQMLGHKHPDVTVKHYTQAAEDAAERTKDALEHALFGTYCRRCGEVNQGGLVAHQSHERSVATLAWVLARRAPVAGVGTSSAGLHGHHHLYGLGRQQGCGPPRVSESVRLRGSIDDGEADGMRAG